MAEGASPRIHVLSLQAGVVESEGALHIRGSRNDEIGYYVEGANVRNVVTGILADDDPRTRKPLESINASTTPWTFQLDLRVDKGFGFRGGEAYRDLYRAINLANRQHYWFAQGSDLYGEPRQIRFGLKLSR